MCGREDDIVPFLDGLQASFYPMPRHHGSIRSQAALQYLVPADDALAVFVGETLHPPNHIALKLFRTLQPLGLHPCLTVRTELPVVLPGLVPADVDVLRREHLEHLQQNLLQEREGALLSRTKFPRVFTPIWQAAGQFGEGIPRFVVMAGHLYFRNHLDMPLLGKGEDVGYVLLRVVSTISPRRSLLHERSAYLVLLPVPKESLRSPSSQVGESWIGINLHTPSGIVHQVEVEVVHLQQSHHLQLLLHEGLALEMTALVEHHAPVAEARPVEDGAASYRAVQRGHHLERLTSIEHAFLVGCHNLNTLLPQLQLVGRLQLPIFQLPAFQMAKERLWGDSYVLAQTGHLFGVDATRASRILHRCRNQVSRLNLSLSIHHPKGKCK